MTRKQLDALIEAKVKKVLNKELNSILMEALIKTVTKDMLNEIISKIKQPARQSVRKQTRRSAVNGPLIEEVKRKRDENLSEMREQSLSSLKKDLQETMPEGMEGIFEGISPIPQNMSAGEEDIPEIPMEALEETGLNMDFSKHIEKL